MYYLMDIGLTAMFDNMVFNLIINGNNLYDRYKHYINKNILVVVTAKCIKDRNLANDIISGVLINISDDCLKIKLCSISVEELGWAGHIYIYNEDIYKLYV